MKLIYFIFMLYWLSISTLPFPLDSSDIGGDNKNLYIITCDSHSTLKSFETMAAWYISSEMLAQEPGVSRINACRNKEWNVHNFLSKPL